MATERTRLLSPKLQSPRIQRGESDYNQYVIVDDLSHAHCRDYCIPLFESKGCLSYYIVLATLSLAVMIWEFITRNTITTGTEEIRLVLDATINCALLSDIIIGLCIFGFRRYCGNLANIAIIFITLSCFTWMLYDASTLWYNHDHLTPYTRHPLLFQSDSFRNTVFLTLYSLRAMTCVYRTTVIAAFFAQEDVAEVPVDGNTKRYTLVDEDAVLDDEQDDILRTYLRQDNDDYDNRFHMPSREDAYDLYYQGH